MALTSVLAFAVLFSFASCEAKPENCTRCKLSPVGGGFSSEFRLKASEKGVRLVYLNLKIGNDSYHPLELRDEFLPYRWVWANTISESMLSLSYDYDILSLGLLTYQVRKMDVQLEDQPSGCLANLNASCQDKVVARVLLNETVHESGELLHETDVVCVAVIEKMNFFSEFFEGNVRYHCCRKSKESSIECELVVKSSGWFKAFNGILNILTLIMVLFCPAFLLALPDFIFNLQEECRKQDQREQRQNQNDNRSTGEESQLNPRPSTYGSINQDLGTSGDGESDPVQRENESTQNQMSTVVNIQPSENGSINQSVVYLDDASPITCSTLFDKYTKKFPDFIFFNVKLAFIFYCVIPFFYYIELALNFTTKRDFFEELSRKQEALLAGPLFSFLSSKESYIMILIVPLLVILYSNPKDFKLNGNCIACKGYNLLVGEEMLKHLEKIQQKSHKFAFWLIKRHRKGFKKAAYCTHSCFSYIKEIQADTCNSRLHKGSIVVFYLFCNVLIISIFGFLLGAVYFFSFLVGLFLLCLFYSPYLCLVIVLIRKGTELVMKGLVSRIVESDFLQIFFSLAILLLTFCYSFFILGILTVACTLGALSCRFVVRMFGFIIIGLVLNAEIASPFVTFSITASTNMYLCYYNLQKKYQEVKEMISQRWQKHKHILENNNLSNSEEGTIPEDLFWHICGEKSKSKHKVLPIRPEVYRMLRNMVLILIFLFLALCSIIFLGNTFNISAVASTIAVFVTGIIPGLFFEGLTKAHRFGGATKSKMIKEIEKAVVEEYIAEGNGTGTTTQPQGSDLIPGAHNE